MPFNFDNITSVLRSGNGVKIAVAGDFCLDKYLYIDGKRDEISLETGQTAYQVTRRALYPGAAGTIANNLSALGVKVVCAGLLGEDGEGWELERCLHNIGADTTLMIKSSRICTSTYVKPMYNDGKTESLSELNRLDLRNFGETPLPLAERLAENIKAALDMCDAMIVCDQFIERNCSAVTDFIRDMLSCLAADYPDKLILCDSRGFINEFRGVTIKCNNHEAAHIFGYTEAENETVIRDCGSRLVNRNGQTAIITCGKNGAWIFMPSSGGITAERVDSFKVDGPVDICGAGDSFNAGFTLGYSLGLTPSECLLVANAVASITIQQIGVTGTATIKQVCGVLETCLK
jgi:bifunctional ADP-heptose synthase (sugar kinase/adenylyltransferase)